MIFLSQVWDFATLSANKDPPPISPNVTINTMEAVQSAVWVGPGILATTSGWQSSNVDLWDVGTHLEKLRKSSRSTYDDTNMHSPLRTVNSDVPLTSMSVAKGLIIVGDVEGNVRVLDPLDKPAVAGGCLQKFSDHMGMVTDVYSVSHAVLVSVALDVIDNQLWCSAAEIGHD